MENKIHEIAGSIATCVPDEGGMMGGKAGLACFCAYYADWSGDQAFNGLAADLIEKALNPAAGRFPGYKFSDGLSGIAWLVHHLSSSGLMNLESASIFDELDPYLYRFMITEVKSGHYDYLHGALGTALYFLRQPKNEKYRAHLATLVVELEKTVENEPDGGLKWLSVLDSETQKTGYNLSLSHGLASIIIVLSKIMKEGILNETCERLIRGSFRYLEKQKLDPGKYRSSFPSWAKESSDDMHSSRLAWCYGDLGIGLAYLEAAALFPGTSYRLDGLDILGKTALRKDPGENNVVDAGICHGASGLALFYNILSQKTKQNVFEDAALHWMDVCLNMAIHKDGLAGYKSWYLPAYGGWKNTEGLLEGITGIGLVLLLFISNREPGWARSLLLI
ncbi:MAG: lanthionine synthetase C family protein [Bacteroidales bacterium]|nr:lanthionine synthetase C family protein [Bacteroidales bacterium]